MKMTSRSDAGGRIFISRLKFSFISGKFNLLLLFKSTIFSRVSSQAFTSYVIGLTISISKLKLALCSVSIASEAESLFSLLASESSPLCCQSINFFFFILDLITNMTFVKKPMWFASNLGMLLWKWALIIAIKMLSSKR